MGAIFTEAPIFLPNYRLEIKDITDTHMDSLAGKLKVNESLTQLFDINVKNSLGEIVDFGNSLQKELKQESLTGTRMLTT